VTTGASAGNRPSSAIRNGLQRFFRFAHAVATNQVARIAPRTYVRLTGETGRGRGEESPQAVADYFSRCFFEYFDTLRIAHGAIGDFLAKKRVLEYGPGDLPGVAVLMVAYGADQVVCVDRFPLYRPSAHGTEILHRLLNTLPEQQRERAASCFRRPGDPQSGFADERIYYMTGRDGLSRLKQEVDFVVSRAVLEHVNNLEATFRDMTTALRPGGIAVHEVDLKSHGLHERHRLDFLSWSSFAWSLMYSHKGVPNRWRVNSYRMAVDASGMKLEQLRVIEEATLEEVRAIRPQLAASFQDLPDDDLACLSFWLVATRPTGESD